MSTIPYFEHYARMNDLSPTGRACYWPMYDLIFSDILPRDRSAQILDIGCGAGLFLEWLSGQKGYSNAIGIDRDPGQVSFARSLGLNVDLIEDPSVWLSERGGFELVVMSDVLEHIASPGDIALLHSVHSAMSSGGTLFLKVPNANSTFAGRFRYIDSTHHRSYTEDSLMHDLSATGFQKVEISAEPLIVPRSLPGLCRFALLLCVRGLRRLEAIGEFGRPGFGFPLSLNLIATCCRGEP